MSACLLHPAEVPQHLFLSPQHCRGIPGVPVIPIAPWNWLHVGNAPIYDCGTMMSPMQSTRSLRTASASSAPRQTSATNGSRCPPPDTSITPDAVITRPSEPTASTYRCIVTSQSVQSVFSADYRRQGGRVLPAAVCLCLSVC